MEGLFQEGQQDRDDDHSLESLSKDHEEYGNGENVDCHVAGGF